jgi:hypothetical protein
MKDDNGRYYLYLEVREKDGIDYEAYKDHLYNEMEMEFPLEYELIPFPVEPTIHGLVYDTNRDNTYNQEGFIGNILIFSTTKFLRDFSPDAVWASITDQTEIVDQNGHSMSFDDIKNGKYKDKVEPIFSVIDKTKREALKIKLPVFTPTGIFEYRSIKGMLQYNGIVCLDIDNINDPEYLKAITANLNYVYASFITPSSHGLKVIIKTEATFKSYKAIEEKAATAFAMDTGAYRDTHAKDIARIQYVSYDPNLYLNHNAIILKTCMI